MRAQGRVSSLAALLAAVLRLPAMAQAPPPVTPTPPAPAPPPPAAEAPPAGDVGLLLPTPIAPTAMKIRDIPSITVEKLSADDPFGKTVDVPAALPAKLVFADATFMGSFFASVRVDPTGKALSVRRDHDPIPSLAAESMKSMMRWTFTPGRRGGLPVDTWGAYQLQLAFEVSTPRIAQMLLTPVTPLTPIPKPFLWGADAEWLESRHVEPPQDGSVSLDQVDTAPMPQKQPWSADSFKGPFSVRYWIKVDKSGRIERAIPIDVTDPVLLAYFRRSMNSWILRPAQVGGAPVDSWNELVLGGTISFDANLKQIVALRKNIGP